MEVARFAFIAASFVFAVRADADPALFESIREADAQLASIGYRLTTANASLCDRLEPAFGLVLHTPEQYARALRKEAVDHFSLTSSVGVEAVIQGSPAMAANIQPDDALVRVGAIRFPPADMQAEANTQALIQATEQMASLPIDKPVEILGQRGANTYRIKVRAVPACRSRFELHISRDFIARADGRMVQISSRFFDTYPPDIVAAVVAHELAHNILYHRERLDNQRVSYGLLAGLGRNTRYFRQTEIEADILSVSLLANAGYDPAVSIQFWKSFGPRRDRGIFSSRSHPGWQDRLGLIEQTIANLDGEHPPYHPAILGARNRPLDGNWQSLLSGIPENK